ncbi:unnamed protein product [Ascophyllum nodosum]
MGSSRIRTLGNALKSAMIGAVVVAGLPRGVAGDTAELTPSSGLTNSAAGFFETAKTMLECQVCKTSQLTGTVDDCCVDYRTVDAATKSSFMPLLKQLQKRIFFKYYKVNLEMECPFWEDDGQCMMRDCSVCECNQEEIPKPWLEEDERTVGQGGVDVQPGDDCSEQIRKEKACQANSETERDLGKVDHSQSSPADGEFNPWSEAADAAVWSLQDEGGEDFQYVNLELNPEKFTGYSGASSARVWGSIYWENLRGFQNSGCMEKRILFRLMSGLHSSIMTQIANEYRFDDGRWGPNTKMFVNAVGMHPDRLTNMYFAYVFVLRAIGKARPFLMAYEYDTGNEEDDALTRMLMNELTNAEHEEKVGLASVDDGVRDHAVPMCLRGFDENGMFGSQASSSGDDSTGALVDVKAEDSLLKQEFMHKFHNISRIMDCVGCESCKLWGKLETLGLGTAIKIMLFSSGEEGQKELGALNRNELIALVNTAAQLAKSVGSVPEWRWLEVKQKSSEVATRLSMAAILVAAVLSAAFYLFRRKSPRGGGGANGPTSSVAEANAHGDPDASSAEGSGVELTTRRRKPAAADASADS